MRQLKLFDKNLRINPKRAKLKMIKQKQRRLEYLRNKRLGKNQ